MSGREEKLIVWFVCVVAVVAVMLMETFRRDCKDAGGVPLTSKFLCLSPDAVIRL